jgi:hypothetical protein
MAGGTGEQLDTRGYLFDQAAIANQKNKEAEAVEVAPLRRQPH